MAVTDTIFGRRGLAVPDNLYIRNGSRTNIDVQTFKVGRLPMRISIGSNIIFTLFFVRDLKIKLSHY